jgi:aryl-alcohol dehydrogenase-like predicted oxidoreductase
VASIQNPYCLINRTFENGLDETCHRLGVSLLAYSPLGFGLLTGKYDATGIAIARRAAGPHGEVRIDEEAALGPPRGAGGRAPLQRAGARARPDAHRNWRWPSATPNGRSPAPSSA